MEARIDRLFQIGGAHAVAAMAYGTRTVPRVDKIVGPGNKWVSAAKALVSADCGIDFYAGPTEILIVANTGPARWIAADLLAQAEHDPDARSVMITTRRRLADQVAAAVERLMPADGPAKTSLHRHGGIIVCRDNAEAIRLANEAASEHLVVENEVMASSIKTAGAVFIGRWTAQVAGDYAIGSNHVLPTAGAARFRGGLSAADFVRLISVQRVTKRGLARIAPTISALARAEGLNGHALSVDMRMADANGQR
jgi:histidinol dehydrogenase